MNAGKIIGAEEILAVTAIVAQDVLVSGHRGLPPPRRILAAFGFYGVLSWVSSLGQQAARVSAALGALVALVLLLGPAGAGLEGLLGNLASFAGSSPGAGPIAPPQAQAAPPKPPYQRAADSIVNAAKSLFSNPLFGGQTSNIGPAGAPISGGYRVAGTPAGASQA